ncbi:MAG TPA: substrate-binding domain-containing protein [Thermoplasmata archaeon]|nr:substrate-binding domain-containing protein [Thermoplasmata archaeon]
MSGKSMRLRERKQRYLRGLRGEKKAVSPVVATLILILIAVAAAAALYLWLVAWQGNITGGIGQPTAQYTVTIGGSTSVYPFTQLAATQFQQNTSDVVISVNQGGSGAGMLAVCDGNVQVGESSSLETPALLQANDGCPSTPGITVTTIAYDADDVIVADTNTHGLLSINYDTLVEIYDQGSTTAPTLQANSIDGSGFTASITPLPAQGTELNWNEIPATVQGAAFPGIGVATDSPETLTGVAAAAGVACTGAAYTNDICATAGPGTGTPCGWTVCAGSLATGGVAIVPEERSDASGTTQAFEARLLDAASKSTFTSSWAAYYLDTGFSGCGGNNVLTDCGITLPGAEQGNGNPGVIANVIANANSIGYASDGLARSTAGIGTAGIIPYLADHEVLGAGIVNAATLSYGAVNPGTGAGGTIAAGITGTSSSVNGYNGWRPFEFVTLQPPTGEVQRFLQFITDPANNILLAAETQEVSIYSV